MMRKRIFRWTALLLVLVLSAGLAGCQSIKNILPSRSGSSADEDSSRGYSIYCISDDNTKIAAFPYKLSSTKETDIINECLKALHGQPDDKDYKPVLDKGLDITKVDYPGSDKTLKLYFPASYSKMSKTKEILVRAAIVKTLTQFSGIVNYVSFCVGDQWLTDKDGSTLKMKSTDFVSTLDLNSPLAEGDFTLYFASGDGKKLMAKEVFMRYSTTMRIEEIVLDALIRGPSDNTCKPVLSGDTQVKSTYVKDGVCLVDFTQPFLDKVNDQNFRLNLYSVVNTLTRLKGIYRVRITVDGKDVQLGPDKVAMGGEISPDEEIIAK